MADQSQPAQGKAVVTGASSGIGQVYADRLAQRGYNLVLVARRADRLNTVADDLRTRYGAKVETVVADLSHTDDLERVAKLLEADQAITLLVNNAGANVTGPVAEGQPAALLNLVELNSVAPLRLALAVLPGFKQRNTGTLINIGSVVGTHPFNNVVVYSATKAFLHSFTLGLATELKDTNVRVQLVAPAGTVSEIWEKGGTPLENFPKEAIMTTENCVDAALKGLDAGELQTFPSLEDATLVDTYTKNGFDILRTSQTGIPASRYRAA